MALLDPALLARLGDLELAARTVVDGLRSGPHRSPFHGYSAEFSQYRHYRPGDDLKYIDWKLLARTDRLYTKQFRETTDLGATIMIDASGSMAFAGDGTSESGSESAPESGPGAGAGAGAGSSRLNAGGGLPGRVAQGRGANRAAAATASVSKLEYACIAAAALAYVISTQGDAVGLLAVQDAPDAAATQTAQTAQTARGAQAVRRAREGPGDRGGRAMTYLAPRSGMNHLRGVIAAMARLTASGAAAPDLGVRRATDLLRRRGLLLVFSDFYDREPETLGELRRAARMGHDVVVFQVVTRAELEFPYRDDIDFRDLESSRSLLTNAREIRTAYKDAFAAFVERWRAQTRAEGLEYTLLVTDRPLDEALRGFLLRRTVA
jgi:uncharacterized protein (DUF58 family)